MTRINVEKTKKKGQQTVAPSRSIFNGGPAQSNGIKLSIEGPLENRRFAMNFN